MSSKKMPQRSGEAGPTTARGSTMTTAGAAGVASRSTMAANPPFRAAATVRASAESTVKDSHVTSAHGLGLSGLVSRKRRTLSRPGPANASGTEKRRFSPALMPPTNHFPPARRATTANAPIWPWRKRVSSNAQGISRQKSSAGSCSLICDGRWYQKRNWNPLE